MSGRAHVVKERPRCHGPVEHGFVYGDRGLFWDARVIRVGFPAEMFTKRRIFSTLQPMPAARCRSCRLVIFQHEYSKFHGGPFGYK